MFDPQTGRNINAGFLDYKIPSALDVPILKVSSSKSLRRTRSTVRVVWVNHPSSLRLRPLPMRWPMP